MSATVKNQGGTAAGPFRFGFYFSTTSGITASSVYSGTACAYPNGLAAGVSMGCSGSVAIPSTLVAGSYYLVAWADDQSQVAESNDSNNTRPADSGMVALSGGTSPTFKIAVNTTTQTVTQGQATSFTLTVQSQNGFTTTVTPAALNLPTGYTSAAWNPLTVTPAANGSASSTLTINTSTATVAGTYTVTLRASAAGYTTQTLPVTVVVTQASASVNLSASTNCNGSNPEIYLSFVVSGGTEASFDLWRNGALYSGGNTGTTFANYGSATVAGQSYSYYVVVHLSSGATVTSNPVTATAPSNCGTALPTITSIVPNPVPLSGSSRTPVDIYGTGFASGGTLHFAWTVSGGGSSSRTDYVLVNSTHVQISIGTGSVASSGWTVQMINASGQASIAYPFSVQ
jgi:hypothetical protein